MKKFSVLALVLFAALANFAQEKTIDKAEFDKVYKSSFRWMADQPRRETEISETSGEFIQPTNLLSVEPLNFVPAGKTLSKSITEFLPNGRYYSIYEFNSGKSNKKRERIRIGDKIYIREDNGSWTESIPHIAALRENTAKMLDRKLEYKFLGSEIINNQSTDVYAAIEKSRIVFSTVNVESAQVNTIKYWFTKDGNLIKTENKREIRSERTLSNFIATRTYEIDPTIKIEAPDLSQTK